MARKKRGRASKNIRQNQGPQAEEEYKKAPHTFVIHRGQVGKNIGDLVMDIRRVMEPYTASKLHVRKKNVLKDFIHMAGPLNVTHFILLSKTEKSVNLRLAKVPHGPTLTFKVAKYSLCRDVVSSVRKAHMEEGQFTHHPLLVMNGFSGEGMHLKLMTTMFQNMFPSLNVNKLKLSSVRRCVLVNYSADTRTIEFRHYNITAVPVGISKGLKKLMKPSVPSMARYDDISEYFMRGNLSESEAEPDEPQNEVILPQKMSGRGNIKSNKSAIRLTEIGPRLTLELIKIEENVCEGEILFHGSISKTDKELAEIRKRRQEKKKLKLERRKQQEENVKKKIEKKEMLKQKCLSGMKEVEDPGGEGDEEKSDSDDDTEYFKREVGIAPDSDLSLAKKHKAKKGKRKIQEEEEISPSKKRKLEKLAEEKKRTKEFVSKILMRKKKLIKKKEKKQKPRRGGVKKSKPKQGHDKAKNAQEHDKDLNVKKGNVARPASKGNKGKMGSKVLGFSAKKGFKTHSKKR